MLLLLSLPMLLLLLLTFHLQSVSGRCFACLEKPLFFSKKKSAASRRCRRRRRHATKNGAISTTLKRRRNSEISKGSDTSAKHFNESFWFCCDGGSSGRTLDHESKGSGSDPSCVFFSQQNLSKVCLCLEAIVRLRAYGTSLWFGGSWPIIMYAQSKESF